MMKKVAVQNYDSVRANAIFGKSKTTGMEGFQAIKHKDGKPYSDTDYMYLLGKRSEELEQKGIMNPYNKDCVAVAKEIVRKKDELHETDKQLHDYLLSCLDLSEIG